MKNNKKTLTIFLLLSLFCVTGCSNNIPFIGENGNWWVGDEDTGESAKGPQGEDGASVTVVSVEKTDSTNNIDTYTITFSDGTKTTFTVTNGDDLTIVSIEKTGSENLVDTYEILFSDGSSYSFTVTNGQNGAVVTIASIEKTDTDGLLDTYTIKLSDGTEFTFNVKNGQDGLTPYIGPNGNWWIGDTDTGEFASYNYETRDITDGLTFTPMTINGKGGFVVTGFDPVVAYGSEICDLLDDYPEQYASTYGIINIPDYLGATPVIGISGDVFDDLDYIGKVSLSRNTIYLGDGSFENCKNLEEVDFNGAKLEKLPKHTFYKTAIKKIDLPNILVEIGDYSLASTKLTSIEFPNSLKKLGNSALAGNLIKNIDINNITHFGDYSLSGCYGKPIYLTKDIEYVGSYAFNGSYVYLEHDTIPSTWGNNISGNDDYGGVVTTNCLINDEYIYAKDSFGITVYNYIGDDKCISVPSMIDNVPVIKIGYGFNSVSGGAINSYANVTNASEWDVIRAFVGLEQVVLPNTVKSIDLGAFVSFFAMVYIPSSVEKMSIYTGFYRDEEFFTNYLIFESNSYPTLVDGWVDGENCNEIESSTWFGDEDNMAYYRSVKNVKWDDVYYNPENKCYYMKDITGYALFAYMDYVETDIVINSVFDGEIVYTIKKGAVCGFYNNMNLIIEDGVKKIQKYAFVQCSHFNYAYIPSSVEVINAYGFADVCDRFYTNHTSQPDEWDSNWAGYYTSNITIYYNKQLDEVALLSQDGKYEYILLDNGTINLVKYLGSSSSSTLKVPREVDGYIISKISSKCYEITYYSNTFGIYIPKTVTILEENAFYKSVTNCHTSVFFEAEFALPGYHEGFVNISSYYLTMYWNRNIGY